MKRRQPFYALFFFSLAPCLPKLTHAPDTDSDGMPDDWEAGHASLTVGVPVSDLDPDGDSLTCLEEYVISPIMDPCAPDTDDDSFNDGLEAKTIGAGIVYEPVAADLSYWYCFGNVVTQYIGNNKPVDGDVPEIKPYRARPEITRRMA